MARLLLIVVLSIAGEAPAQSPPPAACCPLPAACCLPIGDNERVVHIVGTPFNHVYYQSRLETLLLQRYACRGLVFREIAVKRGLAELLKELDAQVIVYRPTLVILQAGNDDLNLQYRRVTFDFTVYRPAAEEIVRRLRAAQVKVVLCSVIPRGSGGTHPSPPTPLPTNLRSVPGERGVNDGLRTWVEDGRQVAARHGAVFVDLFTDAVDWPMISNPPTHYDPTHHGKSWQLFLSQVGFQPSPGSIVEVDARGGQPRCQGAAAAGLAADGGVGLTLRNEAGVGPVVLKVGGLDTHRYTVLVDGKALGIKTAAELAAGIDLGNCLRTQVGTPAFADELQQGHAAVAALGEIHGFQLPAWVRVADFPQQRQAAIQAALDRVRIHDDAMRRLVTPAAMTVRITAADRSARSR